ncbi:MAG TPA: hypothetical protein VGF60_04560 [Xanthobacteraceae bacterium]
MPELDTAEGPITEIAAPQDAPQNMGVSEAARLLRSARKPPTEQPAAPVEAKAPPVEPPQPSEAHPSRHAQARAPQDEADDSPPPEQEATAETESADPQEEAPAPIEPPRSWSKEARERWAKLDPDT